MFNVIADALNMSYTIEISLLLKKNQEDIDDAKNHSMNHNDNQIDEKNRILLNRFRSYFKNNYETILKRDKLTNEIRVEILRQEYCKYLRDSEDNEQYKNTAVSFDNYIVECLDICWIMILQDPPLKFEPMEWKSR